MAKPLTTAGLSLTEVYGSVANDLKKRIGDAQAAQAGPPVSEEIVPATDELVVKAWNERNPEATDEAMRALASERYAAHRAAGMPHETAIRATAEDLTHFRYGQRLKLYTYGQTDFKEQAAEAKRLAKLAARKGTPAPPPPPPTMPSAAATNVMTASPQGVGLGAPPSLGPSGPAGAGLGMPPGGPPELAPSLGPSGPASPPATPPPPGRY